PWLPAAVPVVTNQNGQCQEVLMTCRVNLHSNKTLECVCVCLCVCVCHLCMCIPSVCVFVCVCVCHLCASRGYVCVLAVHPVGVVVCGCVWVCVGVCVGVCNIATLPFIHFHGVSIGEDIF